VALTGTTYDLSRITGALGIARIPWTSTAFTSIGLLVAYDDGDGDNNLTTLSTACSPGADCVRGVSPFLLAYRIGAPIPLQYDGLLHKWSAAVPVADVPDGIVGAASVSSAAGAPTFDITVPADPSTVTVPQFTF
jgi:hypothetical protein